MYQDGRSRRVLFLAHCALNQNAISDGTANAPALLEEVVAIIQAAGDVGVVQMPCPELHCLGLDRGDRLGASRPVTVENTRIRAALEKDGPRQELERLAAQVVYQIRQYRDSGFQVLGIVGMNRSPSCGVDTTSADGREVEGQGLFMARIAALLDEAGIQVPRIGLRSGDRAALEKLARLCGAESPASGLPHT